METTENTTSAQIAEFVPAALQKAINSYHRFMEEVPANEKNFSDYHKASKIALSHIELLIKLSEWSDMQESQENMDISAILEAARRDLAKHNESYSHDFDNNDLA